MTPTGEHPPAVGRLAAEASEVLAESGRTVPGPVLHAVARRVVRSAPPPTAARDYLGEVLAEYEGVAASREVLNATGVLLHTNLGRAPLDPDSLGEAAHVANGYSDVEFDLLTGRRGRRAKGLEASIAALTGAEAALVVNNNAAAVLLVVTALAAGREVVVSRGELVEIGGSFRVPDVITQGGAQLREVGTTNRTHPADYRGAVGERTAAILSVHRSNFTLEGFVSDVSHRELAEVAEMEGVPLVCDLGGGLPDSRCGWLRGGPPSWLAAEPAVRQTLAAGADVVTFSGDKLLGGPQAGIIAGRSELIERVRRHPLARALRLDPLRAGVLQGTVDAYLAGNAGSVLPLWRAASMPVQELAERAERLRASLGGLLERGDGTTVAVAPMDGTVGAGAAPGSSIPGAGLEVRCGDPDRVADMLRRGAVPVVGVVRGGVLRLHLRTVPPEADTLLARALSSVLGPARDG